MAEDARNHRGVFDEGDQCGGTSNDSGTGFDCDAIFDVDHTVVALDADALPIALEESSQSAQPPSSGRFTNGAARRITEHGRPQRAARVLHPSCGLG